MYYRKVVFMAEDKVLKPKSFRIDDETAEKFKAISGAIGGNQQETLAKLIEAYEFQAGKAILTEKKSDIEQFERYVTALTRMYMGSLEDNQNITETVRTEFDALLKSKDATIQDLQGQLTVAKQVKEEEVKRAKYYSDENARLNDVIESMNTEYESKIQDMKEILVDKDKLNKALAESCNDLKQKIDDIKAEHDELKKLRSELSSLKADYSSLLSEKAEIERKLERAKENAERAAVDSDAALKQQQDQAQLKLDKSLLELDKKYQAQIEKLKATKQSEIDKYQQKYLDLLEQIKKNQ